MGERIQRILKTLCLPMNELAAELGVPYDTVKGWSSGRAEPSRENRVKLVHFIDGHIERLQEARDNLRFSLDEIREMVEGEEEV